MNKVRWGIISTANIGQQQIIPAIHRAGNAEVAAIASSNPRVYETAAKLEIPKVYEGYEELLLDPDIDAVYIPLPNSMHTEWTIQAARHKKHVLCEKPAALHPEDLERMLLACEENGVIFMEAFMYRFHPQHQYVRKLLASKQIGEAKLMRLSFSFYMQDGTTNIRMNPELGGGSLWDVGCYCVHSACEILGVQPSEVFVRANQETGGVDTSAFGWMKMKDGVQVLFDSSFEMTMRHSYEIVGTAGRIEVPRAYRPDVHEGEGIVKVQGEDDLIREVSISADQYRLQIEHISRCILENQQPAYSFMRQHAKVMDACQASIRTGQPVQVQY